jgi:hypothetical protein
VITPINYLNQSNELGRIVIHNTHTMIAHRAIQHQKGVTKRRPDPKESLSDLSQAEYLRGYTSKGKSVLPVGLYYRGDPEFQCQRRTNVAPLSFSLIKYPKY